MAVAPDDLRPPPTRLLLAEGRAAFMLPRYRLAARALATAPRGDGHAVLVLPGFAASNRSTAVLRRLLRTLGYDAHGWREGRLVRAPSSFFPGVAAQLAELYGPERRPVSLVGWSLGGVLAREVAREYPQMVRQVITLASPFRAPLANNLMRVVPFVAEAGTESDADTYLARIRQPLPVPATAIYTRSDGIVAWRACLEYPGPRAENVEVRAPHLGLPLDPAVLWIVADRLAQPPGTWAPFRPSGRARRWFRRVRRTAPLADAAVGAD